MKKIILASTSPRRHILLRKTRLRFKIEPSSYEEDMTLPLKPMALAKHLSRGKAEAVAKKYKNAIVIGADTFISFRGRVLGKPHTIRLARKMLRTLSGTTHQIITGFTIIDTQTAKVCSQAVATTVYFKKLSKREIASYARSGESLDRAGAYDLDGLGSIFIRKISGDYTGAVGLPVCAIIEELKTFGITIF